MMWRMNPTVETAAPMAGAGAAAPAGQDTVPDLSSLIAEAQRGSQDAFRALYGDAQPRLLRYLRALVGDDAEDVASEAWLQVARDLDSFAGDYDGFRGWVATIARHRALDQLRRARRRPPAAPVPVDELGDLAAPDDTAAAALEAVSTDAAICLIARLPPDQAEAVLLRTVVGLDAARAARVLGKRPGAVRTAAYRGLRTLGGCLRQHAGRAEPGTSGAEPPGPQARAAQDGRHE
jgi:RNA polymerase sigma-70 factor, ECF subfamily